MSDEALTKFINSINNHLEKGNLLPSKLDKKWQIANSPIDGRGLFAERDIQTNEVIFIDHAFILGPRTSQFIKLLCVVCCESTTTNPVKPCPNSCGLPICQKCTNSEKHREECSFIKSHLLPNVKLEEITEDLFRSLSGLRASFIDEDSKNLLQNLTAHPDDKRNGIELELMKQFVVLSPKEESLIKLACSVLDSNAYECIVYKNESITSLRGLYPLSSVMNHSCVPNTTHLFDIHQHMVVKAARPIKKGQEILAPYTTPFWSTQLRRHLLAATKHFWCQCERCNDPQEFGTQLGALKCIDVNCSGVILPIEPLKLTTKWMCTFCGKCVSSSTMSIVQSAIGSLLVTVRTNDLEQLIILLKDKLKNIVPESNHITVELKLKANWMLGHWDKYKWQDLSLEQLEFKEKICNDILELLVKLRLGQCKLRGLILRELYQCKLEMFRKQSIAPPELLEGLLNEALEILKEDATISQQKIHK